MGEPAATQPVNEDNELKRDIHWSVQLETLIAREAEKCRGLAWIHQRAELHQNHRNNIIQIPVIVFSTVAGTASVGSATLFGNQTTLASIAIGGVSILVGIMNTLGSYFSFAKRAEAHRIAYIQYSKLFSQISIEMALPRNERMAPPQILKLIRDSMERLSETTPSPPKAIIAAFKDEFKGIDDIAMPSETNGLEKVVVYSDAKEQDEEKELSESGKAELKFRIKEMLAKT